MSGASGTSRHARRAIVAAIESLERRVQFDSTFVSISPTPFAQDWTNTTLISTDNDWSGVPGILGYNGAVASSTGGADPQTITADLTSGTSTLQVAANKTDSSDTTFNGIAEFQIVNPVVALKGSGSNDSPFVLLNVNTTGVSSVQVSYNLRDVDASLNDVISAVALQYRVGTSGAFTNVPAGFVADASTGPNLATLVTSVSATLPANAANQPQVQVRIITHDANGQDEWIGVDDIVVKQGGAGALAFAAANVNVNEVGGSATINVTRSGGSSGAVSAHYATTIGTADANDFTPASGDLNFAQGQTTASFSVPITNDAIIESAEMINLTLTSPTNGATLGTPSTATITIFDNDGAPPPGVLLNEIDVNPPGAGAGFEYVEIKAPTGTNLSDLYFVSIEGDPGGAGQADLVVNLSSASIGSNGLLMLKGTSGGFTPDAGTSVLALPAFDGSPLENAANSFALLYSQTPLVQGSDLDPEDDGVLNLPPGAVVTDGIGWKDGGIVGTTYGALLSDSSSTPDAATRYPSNTTPLSSSAWYSGNLLDNNNPGQTLYDTSDASLLIPPGSVITPGAPNYSNASTAGELGFSSFNYSVSESGGFATIVVERTAGVTGAVTVDYAASAGSATSGADFLPVSGTLNFADAQTSANFTLPILDDTILDPAETINLTLSSPTGGALIGPRASATLTIADNDVLLNEIKVNPPGSADAPHEWIEVKATPGMTLDNIFVVSVEGDAPENIGLATAVFNLTGVAAGSNGLLLLKSASNTDFTPAAGTTVVNSTAFDTALLQNDSNSFMVIYSPSTAIALNSDLDPDNDGNLDLPSGAVVLDGIGWKDSNGKGTPYAPALTQSSGTPDAATRFANDTDALSNDAWYNGDLVDTGNDPSQIAYDPVKCSDNLPTSAALTPGDLNFGNRETTAPALDAEGFEYDTTAQRITLDFSESVLAHFSTKDFTLVNRTAGNTVVPMIDFSIIEESGNVIVLTFPTDPAGALPDGRYRLTILHSGVKDDAGNALSQDATLDFFVLSADANHDATVNALDFNALASHFGLAGTFSQGDFNYDGTINTLDFNALAMRFNVTLPAAAAAALSQATLFSTVNLDKRVFDLL